MQFKKGEGWKACYDETTGKYTAKRSGPGYYHLYEITKEIFDLLEDGMSDSDTYKMIDNNIRSLQTKPNLFLQAAGSVCHSVHTFSGDVSDRQAGMDPE